MKVLLCFFVVVLLFGSVISYQYYVEDASVLADLRAVSGDGFIQSETGVTRYQIFGESNRRTVVLIHSFNGFLESWSPNVASLVDAGYRVVVYDLFGRGLSDRPSVDYDLALFRSQLDLVLNHVGGEDVYLVGSSFGCVIAADYANHYPEKVNGLAMVGPAGWPQEVGRNPVLDIPVLGDLVFHYFGERILKPKVKDYFVNSSKYSEAIELWAAFASYPGSMRSALSTLRHSPVLDYTAGWKALGKLKKPTVFIWGKLDVSFPFSNTDELPSLVPHAKIVGIENAAHWVNIEQADQVNNEIISFFGLMSN